MTYKIINSKTLHKGRIFDLVSKRIRYPDGREANFEIIRHPGAIAVIPINGKGEIIFVKQYRPAIASQLLEIPAGGLEKGESAKDCAIRELQEEIGMLPGKLEKLLDVYIAPGYSDEIITFFLASELTPSSLLQDEDEEIEIISLTVSKAFAQIESAEIKDAKTILALTYARSMLQ